MRRYIARLLQFMEMFLQSINSFFSNPTAPSIKRNDTMKGFILIYRIYPVTRTNNVGMYVLNLTLAYS